MENSSKIPLALKAEEICDTIRTLVGLIPSDHDILQALKDQLLENCIIITAKIAGAEGVKLWDIKMENAAAIRKAARELKVAYHSLALFGFEEAEYYKIVRRQIEEFRLLFRAWVLTFNPKHFITDDWGLFNPPGIAQDYEQSEDELGFLDD